MKNGEAEAAIESLIAERESLRALDATHESFQSWRRAALSLLRRGLGSDDPVFLEFRSLEFALPARLLRQVQTAGARLVERQPSANLHSPTAELDHAVRAYFHSQLDKAANLLGSARAAMQNQTKT